MGYVGSNPTRRTMKNRLLFFILILIGLIAIGYFLYPQVLSEKNTDFDYTKTIESNNNSTSSIKEVNLKESVHTQASSSVKTTTTSPTDFSYLFTTIQHDNVSSIVGYFGGGSFVWYLPDWLVNNWDMTTLQPDDMVFKPKIRRDSNDFSDLFFDVEPSSETYNAVILFQNKINSTSKSNLVIQETLLNKHNGDQITLIVETNTHIYHIIDKEGIYTNDTYYIDGNGKTLVVTFKSKSEIFSQFSEHIRNMIEGIGELKKPQG